MSIIVLSTGLAIWFALSVANQINPLSARLAAFDPLGLLPRWTFFAPHPGIYDYHLLYRECDAPDVPLGTALQVEEAKALVGPWRQVDGLSSAPRHALFWNPQRRVTKTITDIVAGLTTLRLDRPELNDALQYTSYYWLLLHLVARQAQRAGQRQFALIQSHGFPPERRSAVFFVSNFHPVGGDRRW